MMGFSIFDVGGIPRFRQGVEGKLAGSLRSGDRRDGTPPGDGPSPLSRNVDEGLKRRNALQRHDFEIENFFLHLKRNDSQQRMDGRGKE